MKVVHFTNNLNDGAGKAAYRLHKALQGQGVESLMLVYRKNCSDNTVIDLSTHLNILRKFSWKLKAFRWRPLTLFNFNIGFITVGKILKYIERVDVICLYSLQAFLSSGLIRKIYMVSKAPIVWTPLDIEPLTGGCHFNNSCMNFTKTCGNCPQLGSRNERDISRHVWGQKNNNLKNLPITFVAGSTWAYNCIEASSLFKTKQIKKILLGVDKDISVKVDKQIARKILQLPKEKKIIFFGAFNLNDKRKGMQYLLPALSNLYKKLKNCNRNLCDSITLLTMGRQNGFKPDTFPFSWIHFGEVHDDRILSLLYQASDVLACPSIEDFGPVVINEALACSTPVVAFHVGVAPDLIKLKKDGYIAKNYCTDDFSSGLFQCIFENSSDNYSVGQECNIDFSPSSQAKQYISLFKELLVKNE